MAVMKANVYDKLGDRSLVPMPRGPSLKNRAWNMNLSHGFAFMLCCQLFLRFKGHYPCSIFLLMPLTAKK
jgi:hypothetical protein